MILELALTRLLNQLLRRKIQSDQRSVVLFKVARCYLKVRLMYGFIHVIVPIKYVLTCASLLLMFQSLFVFFLVFILLLSISGVFLCCASFP